MTVSEKTQSLRRYEAVPQVIARDRGEPPLELYSPFGPVIAKVRLPDALLRKINDYADTQVSPRESREFLLPDDIVFGGETESLAHQTAQWIARYLASLHQPPLQAVNFEVFWVVSQYPGTPSPVHFHTGDVSGVLYLRVPETDPTEETKTYISGRQAGYINFMTGGREDLSKTLISFKPEAGDFYLFPAWLLHGAEPFKGSGERRSMAFNAVVEYRKE